MNLCNLLENFSMILKSKWKEGRYLIKYLPFKYTYNFISLSVSDRYLGIFE
jgi:hypothetical protein